MTDTPLESPPGISRRTVALGACVVAGATLSGCTAYDTSVNTTDPEPTASKSKAGVTLTAVADVPVGGGVVIKKHKVVVTQPEEGEFKAFSSVCTHQGCTVAEVAGRTINCPCHGSKFSITDGSVVSGPAPKPLPPQAVTVDGTQIVSG